MLDLLSQRWPWWAAGPLLGLVVPLLLVFDQRSFGISSSLRHVAAACCGRTLDYFDYDWRRDGLWNLAFALGLVGGGVLAASILAPSGSPPVDISEETWRDLAALGVAEQPGMAPAEIFSWERLGTLAGFVSLVIGGFLLGFGARWGGGCTSGHGITGLATLQLPSLLAVSGFFAGGLTVTWFVLPLLLGPGGDGG